MLAATLRGVVGQRLVRSAGGEGRVAVCEVLVVTGRVQDLILNPKETGQDHRGDRRGRVLRDADLRPGAAQARDGGQHRRGDRVRGRLEPARLQADARRRRASARAASSRSSATADAVAARPTAAGSSLKAPALLRKALAILGEVRPQYTPAGRAIAMSESPCPVGCCAEIISGKWTLLVIRDLADASRRFCELERSLEGISPRTLSLRLRALEERGDRRAPHLPRGPAPGRVRADREGPRARPADRGHARVRAPLAGRRRQGEASVAGRGVASIAASRLQRRRARGPGEVPAHA